MTTTKAQTAKHTPGPWRSHDHHDKRHREYAIMAGEGEGAVKVASCHTHHVPWDVAAVNSHLIAAAPETAAERDRLKEINAELLAALEEIRDGAISRYPAHVDAFKNRTKSQIEEVARAAIARATGEA